MKMMVVSRTESSFEILSIGINPIYFIGINRFIPYTVTVGLQMIISAHCHQITFESKVGDSLSLAPGSTPDVRHSSSTPHPGGFFLAFTPTPPSSITFLMTSHCVLQQRLNHKNTKEAFSCCDELKKVWKKICLTPRLPLSSCLKWKQNTKMKLLYSAAEICLLFSN